MATYLNSNEEFIFSENIRNRESHVSKIDSLGNPLWTKTFPYSNNNFVGDILVQKDEIILLNRNNRY